jgi:predicted amidophosphoribosyltransferase
MDQRPKGDRMHFSHCPRCGGPTLEHLSTHSHCWECSYSPDSDHRYRSWHRLEFPYEHPGSRNLFRLDQTSKQSDLRA